MSGCGWRENPIHVREARKAAYGHRGIRTLKRGLIDVWAVPVIAWLSVILAGSTRTEEPE